MLAIQILLICVGLLWKSFIWWNLEEEGQWAVGWVLRRAHPSAEGRGHLGRLTKLEGRGANLTFGISFSVFLVCFSVFPGVLLGRVEKALCIVFVIETKRPSPPSLILRYLIISSLMKERFCLILGGAEDPFCSVTSVRGRVGQTFWGTKAMLLCCNNMVNQTLCVETVILSCPLEISCGFESACSETNVMCPNVLNQWWSFSQDIFHFVVILCYIFW